MVTLVVEGTTDAAIARRLLSEAQLQCGPEYITGGKGKLDSRLAGFNSAARFSPWLVIRDLDQDADCAPVLRTKLLPVPAAHMRLHVAVHSLEAWLLADAEAISKALSISRSRVPIYPDALLDPKQELIDLARHSRRRLTREALVPPPGLTARVGPGFAAFLSDFGARSWRPAVAATRSPSLARLRAFLATL